MRESPEPPITFLSRKQVTVKRAVLNPSHSVTIANTALLPLLCGIPIVYSSLGIPHKIVSHHVVNQWCYICSAEDKACLNISNQKLQIKKEGPFRVTYDNFNMIS